MTTPLHALPTQRSARTNLLVKMQTQPHGLAMPTNEIAMDDLIGDYLRTGNVITLVGAPGSGKTAIAIAIASALLPLIDRVVIAALDRGGRGLVRRLATHRGITGSEKQIGTLLEAEFSSLWIDNDSLTSALSELEKGGKRQLLVVDSIQVAARGYRGNEARQRIEGALADIERARQLGALVVVTSEASRGATGDSIGAAKDSSSIEHASDCQLFLQQAARDTPRRFRAAIQKPVGLDEARWFDLLSDERLVDVTAAAPSKPSASSKAEKSKPTGKRRAANAPALTSDQLDAAVRNFLLEHPDSSGNAVATRSGIKGRKARIDEALKRVGQQSKAGGWHARD